MTRNERLSADLDLLQEIGLVTDWYTRTGDGRRWVVGVFGGVSGPVSFTTRDVENWARGALAAADTYAVALAETFEAIGGEWPGDNFDVDMDLDGLVGRAILYRARVRS